MALSQHAASADFISPKVTTALNSPETAVLAVLCRNSSPAGNMALRPHICISSQKAPGLKPRTWHNLLVVSIPLLNLGQASVADRRNHFNTHGR